MSPTCHNPVRTHMSVRTLSLALLEARIACIGVSLAACTGTGGRNLLLSLIEIYGILDSQVPRLDLKMEVALSQFVFGKRQKKLKWWGGDSETFYCKTFAHAMHIDMTVTPVDKQNCPFNSKLAPVTYISSFRQS
mmetsp:Transcript_50871/g.99737  ORF Transcript_50871/g.99737 Transcript_50871/m.99737 type:complete len:135 (+) Transcript_50871:112-516(+)